MYFSEELWNGDFEDKRLVYWRIIRMRRVGEIRE